jgi:hypothetical protein
VTRNHGKSAALPANVTLENAIGEAMVVEGGANRSVFET